MGIDLENRFRSFKTVFLIFFPCRRSPSSRGAAEGGRGGRGRRHPRERRGGGFFGGCQEQLQLPPLVHRLLGGGTQSQRQGPKGDDSYFWCWNAGETRCVAVAFKFDSIRKRERGKGGLFHGTKPERRRKEKNSTLHMLFAAGAKERGRGDFCLPLSSLFPSEQFDNTPVVAATPAFILFFPAQCIRNVRASRACKGESVQL